MISDKQINSEKTSPIIHQVYEDMKGLSEALLSVSQT